MSPAIPAFSVQEAWLFSHGGHIPSPGLEAFLLQVRVQPAAFTPTLCCASWLPRRTSILLFLRQQNTENNSMTHQPGKYWLPGNPGTEWVGCSALNPFTRGKGKIPKKKKYLQNSSLSPTYWSCFFELLAGTSWKRSLSQFVHPTKELCESYLTPVFPI